MSVTVDVARIGRTLDLERRLAALPGGSTVRGVFFNQIEEYLRRELHLDAATLRELLGESRRSYKMYSAHEFLRTCALSGALASSDPVEGMRTVARGMSSYFVTTWHGRVFQRFLRPDPFTALQFVARSREYVASYGTVRTELRGPGHAIVHIFDEPLWIDVFHRGGCEGLLAACGVNGEVTADLDAGYRGRLIVHWTLPPAAS